VKAEACSARLKGSDRRLFLTGVVCAQSKGEVAKEIKISSYLSPRLENIFAEEKIPVVTGKGKISLPQELREEVEKFISGGEPDLTRQKARIFLRGVAVSAGHIADPSQSYKVELHIKNDFTAKLVTEILAAEDIQVSVRVTQKYNNVYFKNGDSVSDFLGIIGADGARLEFENVRIEHEVRRSVNRTVNCDDGNIKRQAEAGALRHEVFEKLLKSDKAASLSPELYAAAVASIENPGASIAELGAMMDPPIGKSGMSHRISRLMDIANAP